MSDLDISLFGPPNIHYEKFFKKFNEIDVLSVNQWSGTHLIGYFCKKYNKHYNSIYKFKFNSSSPSKSFESFQIKKLALLLSSDPTILKDYIDWVFNNKIIKAKRKITSISFLTKEEHTSEFKLAFCNPKIDRNTLLPEKYLNLIRKSFPINTYGDLAFLYKMSPRPADIVTALESLKSEGFDETILGKIV